MSKLVSTLRNHFLYFLRNLYAHALVLVVYCLLSIFVPAGYYFLYMLSFILFCFFLFDGFHFDIEIFLFREEILVGIGLLVKRLILFLFGLRSKVVYSFVFYNLFIQIYFKKKFVYKDFQ